MQPILTNSPEKGRAKIQTKRFTLCIFANSSDYGSGIEFTVVRDYLFYKLFSLIAQCKVDYYAKLCSIEAANLLNTRKLNIHEISAEKSMKRLFS